MDARDAKEMTPRRYYQDANKRTFAARILERVKYEGKPAVILDQTYFYPTSGGQPNDTGQIDDARVTDVFVREADQAIVHVLDGDVIADTVSCAIDWERRFDHMQQHTGQHILSQAFVLAAGAETVSFHLGKESSTLDLDVAGVSQSQMREAENIANQIVWENRKVKALTLSREEVAALNLRKVPEVTGDELRLIEVEDFDIVACGGTHVSRAGEIGVIKIVKSERLRSSQRLDFLCGRRALDDYEQKNRILLDLAAELTTGYWEVGDAVQRLREDASEARRLVKRQQKRLADYEAVELLDEAQGDGEISFVVKLFPGRDPAEVRQLANLVVRTAPAVALFGIPGNRAQLVFARSKEAQGNMAELMKSVLQPLGSSGGGGTAFFAQGGGLSADQPVLEEALAGARQLLLQMMSTESNG